MRLRECRLEVSVQLQWFLPMLTLLPRQLLFIRPLWLSQPYENIIAQLAYSVNNFCKISFVKFLRVGFTWRQINKQAVARLLVLVVSSCSIIPTRRRGFGVGGSVNAIALGVILGGVVRASGGIEAVDILGAVGGVGETFRAIAIHHGRIPSFS